ncbi:hypothetical protein [Algibacter lectus]|nr:hypothetical protein [Algibacter lectus]
MYIGAILSCVFIFLFKKKKTYFITGITISMLFIMLNFLINIFRHKHSTFFSNHSTVWNSNKHNTTIPFYSSESGHLFLKAKIGNETKYIGFDTGAELCGFNENYNNSKKTTIISLTDSQNKTKNIRIQKLDKLTFKNIDFEKVDYISMNKDIWENECGIFFNQDSIAGVLGNNIINSFIWDFDMLNKTVKISEEIELQNISKFEIIPLLKSGKKSWSINIKVNGNRKRINLDTGFNGTLTIKDSIILQENYKYKIGHSNSIGLFSFENCYKKKDSSEITKKTQKGKRQIFADLKISNINFKNVLIEDTSNSNLIGVPLIWEYERVILDFLNGKMYLFNKNHSKSAKSISNISNKAREEFVKKNCTQDCS